MEFKATHVITLESWNGTIERIPVLQSDNSLYTEEEWNTTDRADWTVDNGNLLIQGRAPVCRSYAIEMVQKKYTLRDLVWTYKNIVGVEPSERTIDELPDYCNQEDYESYVVSFMIEREQLEEEKNRLE